MKRPWLFLLVTMASSGWERGCEWSWLPCWELGGGRSWGGGSGGHWRPSIDSRRLEFIRYKPREAIVSFATAPMKSRGPLREAWVEVGQGWPALGYPREQCTGAGGPEQAGVVEKSLPSLEASLLTSAFPLSKVPH